MIMSGFIHDIVVMLLSLEKYKQNIESKAITHIILLNSGGLKKNSISNDETWS